MTKQHDWVRDANGFVDSRMSARNARKLLQLVKAKSLVGDVK